MLIGFCMLGRLDYPLLLNEGDGMRDHLVASHIARYSELVLAGPFNSGTHDTVPYSPAYYYFLASILSVFRSFWVLGIANILLQLGGAYLVYRIASIAFGRSRGVIAMILYGFTPFMREQAHYLWQPYVSQFFVLWSIYFLFRFARERAFRLLLAGFCLSSVAAVMHTAAAGMVLVYGAAAWYLSRHQERAGTRLLLLFLTGVFIILMAYLPTLFVPRGSPVVGSLRFSTAGEWVDHANAVYAAFGSAYAHQNGIAAAGMGLSVYYLTRKAVMSARRRFFAFLFACTAAGLFSMFVLSAVYPVYLFPVVAFLPIMLAESVQTIFTRRFARITILTLLIVVFSDGLVWVGNPIAVRPNALIIKNATAALSNEIIGIQRENSFNRKDFFQTRSYYPHAFGDGKGVDSTYISEAVLLAPLEERLNTKLIAITSTGTRIQQTNASLYVFVACYYREKEKKESVNGMCIDEFKKELTDYAITGEIFSSDYLTVYKAKKDYRT